MYSTAPGYGSNDPATYAGEMGIVEDEPVHLRIRSAHPGQRDSDCIDLTVMPFNTWQMVKMQMREHRSGLRAIPDNNIRLLHKGIELRGGHPVENYIHGACGLSPAEIQYVILDQGDRVQSAADIAMYKDEQVPTSAKTQNLVNEISDAMLHGINPKLTEDGTGATYMLRGASSSKTLAVFKPKDEEAFAPNNPRGYVAKENSPGLRQGVLSTQQAAREVAAYLLDHKHFAGVPPTTLVHAKHPAFVNPNKKVAWKIGAFQEFVHAHGTCGDYGRSMFNTASVHAIGILDVRIVNLDRNDGNLLVAIENKRPRLIPIDHGLSLPDRLEVYTCDLVWMEWPQAREPFAPAELEYIRSLDGARDAANIEHQVGVRRECLRLLEVTTTLLQKGAEHGLSLHQIGLIMYREDRCSEDEAPVQPSILERMLSRCVDSAAAAVGDAHGTVSSTVESLDLLSIRATSPIRRQVSGDPGFAYPIAPSPLPSPMFSPAICKAVADLQFPPLDGDIDQVDFARAASPEGRGNSSEQEMYPQDQIREEESPDDTVGLRRMRGSAARHRHHLSVRPSALRNTSGASREGAGKDASTAIFARPHLDGSKWSKKMEEAFKRHFEDQLAAYLKKHFPDAGTKTIIEGDEGQTDHKVESNLASGLGVRPSDVD